MILQKEEKREERERGRGEQRKGKGEGKNNGREKGERTTKERTVASKHLFFSGRGGEGRGGEGRGGEGRGGEGKDKRAPFLLFSSLCSFKLLSLFLSFPLSH